jgi:hypothetical protein
MSTAEQTSRYFIQSMTGRLHTDRRCSTGAARYYHSPALGTAAELEQAVADGKLKGCKRCGTAR